LSADAITTFATPKTIVHIPSAAAAATNATFICRRHHFLSDSTDYRQHICHADTPSVSAAAATLSLSPMPLPPPFPPRQPPLTKISNLQVG
jgi:hypothetical protein